MAGFDRSRINLGRRTQEQTDNRESNGATRKTFMNYSQCGLKFFKFADVGKFQDINILPWRISSKNHPGVVDGKYEIGDYDYVLDLWIHSRIGPGEEDCVCLKRTYGKPCPICDEADRLWANPETKESARQFFAKRKCIYLVDELNDKFESVSNEPKIFEVTHGLFSKDLQSKATSCLRGKGVVDFASVNVDSKGREIGKVVSFTIGEGTMGNGKKFKKAENFEFNDRVQEITDEMLEKCPSLDSMLIVKTPDEMKAMLYGEPDSEETNGGDGYDGDNHNSNPARFNENDNTTARGGRSRRDDDDDRNNYREDRSRNNENPAREERSRRDDADNARDYNRAPARFADNNPEDDAPARGGRSRRDDDGESDYRNEHRRNESVREERSRHDDDANIKPDGEAPVRGGRSRRDDGGEADYRNERRRDESEADYQSARNASRRGTAADEPSMPFDEPADTHNDEPAEPKRDCAGKCPFGHVFGKDCERGNNCGRCPDDVYAKCSAAHQQGRG